MPSEYQRTMLEMSANPRKARQVKLPVSSNEKAIAAEAMACNDAQGTERRITIASPSCTFECHLPAPSGQSQQESPGQTNQGNRDHGIEPEFHRKKTDQSVGVGK